MSSTFDENTHRWYVSDVSGDAMLEVQVKSTKDSVYLEKCTGGVVKIIGKVNAVTVNNCASVGVVLDDAISIIEIINSKKVQCQVLGTVPTIHVDRSVSTTVYASEASKEVTKLVTVHSSGTNYLVPDGDDMKEHPVPELIESLFEKGVFVSRVADDTIGV